MESPDPTLSASTLLGPRHQHLWWFKDEWMDETLTVFTSPQAMFIHA